jgi:hypothetical protein
MRASASPLPLDQHILILMQQGLARRGAEDFFSKVESDVHLAFLNKGQGEFNNTTKICLG